VNPLVVYLLGGGRASPDGDVALHDALTAIMFRFSRLRVIA
jgi:hypothetical protein